MSAAAARGHSFFSTNAELLEAYAACNTAGDIIAAQNAWLQQATAAGPDWPSSEEEEDEEEEGEAATDVEAGVESDGEQPEAAHWEQAEAEVQQQQQQVLGETGSSSSVSSAQPVVDQPTAGGDGSPALQRGSDGVQAQLGSLSIAPTGAAAAAEAAADGSCSRSKKAQQRRRQPQGSGTRHQKGDGGRKGYLDESLLPPSESSEEAEEGEEGEQEQDDV